MEQEKHYRHELKYAIPYAGYLGLRSRLKQLMKTDPHVSENGTYRIRSIYFDNCEDKALLEKINGVGRREKFRIRYYNDDLSFITLEKKMKIDRLCLKYDAPLSEEECRQILELKFEKIREHPSELVRELYAKMIYQRLRPRVLVSYTREPYIYPAGNVRVTFDSEVRTSLFTREFLKEEVFDISATDDLFTREFLKEEVFDISATDDPGDRIMEVKYDAFLPSVIQTLIQSAGMRQMAFSKYGMCRRFG